MVWQVHEQELGGAFQIQTIWCKFQGNVMSWDGGGRSLCGKQISFDDIGRSNTIWDMDWLEIETIKFNNM